MGALKGSISYSKFQVRGEFRDGMIDKFVERIRARAFQPLVVEEEASERWGWCSIEHPFDLELDHEKVIYNSYLNLGFRMDRWAIPGPLMKAHYAQAEKLLLEKKGRERLSRAEKDELKVTVARRLRKQVFPAMKVVDMSWNMETGAVRFWNQSPKVHDLFQEVFEKTFELDLVPDSPYTKAPRAPLSEHEMGLVEALEQTSFHVAH